MNSLIKRSKQGGKGWVNVENGLRLVKDSANYVRIPNKPEYNLHPNASFSLSLSFYLQEYNAYAGALFYARDSTLENNGFSVSCDFTQLDGNTVDKYVRLGGGFTVNGTDYFINTPSTAATTFKPNTWILVTVTYSHVTRELSFYANGLKIAGSVLLTDILTMKSNLNDIAIGHWINRESAPLFFTGGVRNYVIYNKALSPGEVDLLGYEIGLVPKELHQNVQGHWPLNQRYGKQAWDTITQYNYAIPDSITNMNFDNDVSGWSIVDNSAVLSWENGTAKIVNQGTTAGGGIVTTFTMRAGVRYISEVRFTKTYGDQSGDGYIDFEGVGGYQIGFAAGPGTYTATTYETTSSFDRNVPLKLHLGLGLGAVGNVDYFRIYKVNSDGSRVLAYPKKANHGELIGYTDEETGTNGQAKENAIAWVDHYAKTFSAKINSAGIEIKTDLPEIASARQTFIAGQGARGAAINYPIGSLIDTAMYNDFGLSVSFYWDGRAKGANGGNSYGTYFLFMAAPIEIRVVPVASSPSVDIRVNGVITGIKLSGAGFYTCTISRPKGKGQYFAYLNNNSAIASDPNIDTLSYKTGYVAFPENHVNYSDDNIYPISAFFYDRVLSKTEHLEIFNHGLFANPKTKKGLIGAWNAGIISADRTKISDLSGNGFDLALSYHNSYELDPSQGSYYVVKPLENLRAGTV